MTKQTLTLLLESLSAHPYVLSNYYFYCKYDYVGDSHIIMRYLELCLQSNAAYAACKPSTLLISHLCFLEIPEMSMISQAS